MANTKRLIDSYQFIEPIFITIIKMNPVKAILTNKYLVDQINKELINQKKKRHTISTQQLGKFIFWQKNYYAFRRTGATPVEYIFVELTQEQKLAYKRKIRMMYG